MIVEERQQGELQEEAWKQVVEEVGGFPQAMSEGGGRLGRGLEEGCVEIVVGEWRIYRVIDF